MAWPFKSAREVCRGSGKDIPECLQNASAAQSDRIPQNVVAGLA